MRRELFPAEHEDFRVSVRADLQLRASVRTDLQLSRLDRCLQLHGGYGYMEEYPIARMWPDGRVQRIYCGTNEIMREIVRRALGA